MNLKILNWSTKPDFLRQCGSWEKLYIEVFISLKQMISDIEFWCWWTGGFLVMDYGRKFLHSNMYSTGVLYSSYLIGQKMNWPIVTN